MATNIYMYTYVCVWQKNGIGFVFFVLHLVANKLGLHCIYVVGYL